MRNFFELLDLYDPFCSTWKAPTLSDPYIKNLEVNFQNNHCLESKDVFILNLSDFREVLKLMTRFDPILNSLPLSDSYTKD